MSKRSHWEDGVVGSDYDTTWTTGETELDSRKSLQHSLLYNGHRTMFPIVLIRPQRTTYHAPPSNTRNRNGWNCAFTLSIRPEVHN